MTGAVNRYFWTCGLFADFVAGTALCEPRSADFVAGTTLCEPRSADFVAGAALGEPRSADFVAGRFRCRHSARMPADEKQMVLMSGMPSSREQPNSHRMGRQCNNAKTFTLTVEGF